MKKTCFLAAVLVALMLPALASAQDAPGQVISNTFVTSTTQADMTQVILDFYPSPQFQEATYAVDEYDMTITTEDSDGSILELRAQMFVPNIPEPLAAPVYVFGAGTTGLVNECAP
ncbi:MAG: hypothetical protein AAFV33_24950, partial [Chloroflexota bacterium]